MTRMRTYSPIALGLAFVMALAPGAAYAASDTLQTGEPVWGSISETASEAVAHEAVAQDTANALSFGEMMGSVQQAATDQLNTTCATVAQYITKTDKLLSYGPAALAAIGTQESTGHSICCPSFSCAYADAVLDGTIHDHDYYSCSCCTWTDWGGGNSSDRCVGTDEQLLREAYDQISAGKPTVIHVSWSGGEHWITLIGYENAIDPDHLTLSNFIALDPWDGVQLNAGSKYELYGDGCEHISER